MKHILLFSIMALIGQCAVAQINFNKIKSALGKGKLSQEEVGAGLKEALHKGVSKSADLVSKVDGYLKNPEIKIPFPPDVKNVEEKLRQIGMGTEVDNFIVSLNRAAEDAAKEAKPIFLSAVTEMTIQDAWSILNGKDNAATEYLIRVTAGQLHEKFKPVIQRSLEKVNATQYYNTLITTYNKIPFVRKLNPDLDDYATARAVDGIFVMIAKEERNIRRDPGARTSALLKRVFGAQK